MGVTEDVSGFILLGGFLLAAHSSTGGALDALRIILLQWFLLAAGVATGWTEDIAVIVFLG